MMVDRERDRETAETGREAAEGGRRVAERGRVAAEAGVETDRAQAERGRAGAEPGRAGAERGRVTAEAGRAEAETDRVDADTARIVAEGIRSDARARTGGLIRFLIVLVAVLSIVSGIGLFLAIRSSSQAASLGVQNREVLAQLEAIRQPTPAQRRAELENAIRGLTRSQRHELYCVLRLSVPGASDVTIMQCRGFLRHVGRSQPTRGHARPSREGRGSSGATPRAPTASGRSPAGASSMPGQTSAGNPHRSSQAPTSRPSRPSQPSPRPSSPSSKPPPSGGHSGGGGQPPPRPLIPGTPTCPLTVAGIRVCQTR